MPVVFWMILHITVIQEILDTSLGEEYEMAKARRARAFPTLSYCLSSRFKLAAHGVTTLRSIVP